MNRNESNPDEPIGDESPLFCDRCLKILHYGRGEFFQVNIHAVADPSPPDLDAYGFSPQETGGETFNELVRQMSSVSAREAMDEVMRRVQINLCNDCFKTWIEEPAAGP